MCASKTPARSATKSKSKSKSPRLPDAMIVHSDPADGSAEIEPAADAVSAADSAPVPADGLTFRGVKLERLSASRLALFLQHRLAVGAPPLEMVVSDVNAFLSDALRILYLVSHDSAVWGSLRSSPQALEDAISHWADKGDGEDLAGVTLLGLRIYSATCEVVLTPTGV